MMWSNSFLKQQLDLGRIVINDKLWKKRLCQSAIWLWIAWVLWCPHWRKTICCSCPFCQEPVKLWRRQEIGSEECDGCWHAVEWETDSLCLLLIKRYREIYTPSLVTPSESPMSSSCVIWNTSKNGRRLLLCYHKNTKQIIFPQIWYWKI